MTKASICGVLVCLGLLITYIQINVSSFVSTFPELRHLASVASAGEGNNAELLLSKMNALQSRLESLERTNKLQQLKMNSWMNWNSNPFLGSVADAGLCDKVSDLSEHGCSKGQGKCPGEYDHKVCLDKFPPKRDCIVYDFGIRENPDFGKTLLHPPFRCKVFAFDPSPITLKWYTESDSSKELRDNPNYHLFHYGAGGVDGTVRLNKYDWGQVSIIRFPLGLDCDNATVGHANCKLDYPSTGSFQLPVKTLGTIMKELNHTHIDMLKVDVEGSEYAFLEQAVDEGSLGNVDQLTVEWHHYDFDSRYGGGSSPAINALVALMDKMYGLKQFHIHMDNGGWPSLEKEYYQRGIRLYYNLASFIKVQK